MTHWTEAPEAAALLASCVTNPPRRRLVAYRFQETGLKFVGRRMQTLRRLYRLAEPPLDSPAWRDWLALDPQRAIEAAMNSAPTQSTLPLPQPARSAFQWRTNMHEPHDDPMTLHSRLIGALCEDLAGFDFRRNGGTPRADALFGTGRKGGASPAAVLRSRGD
jgi:hypothetical protein